MEYALTTAQEQALLDLNRRYQAARRSIMFLTGTVSQRTLKGNRLLDDLSDVYEEQYFKILDLENHDS